MKIQFNTGKNIEGKETLENLAAEKIGSGLKHFADNITRIEVHLSDQNADKGGIDDIKCKIEARVKGTQPVIVISNSGSKERAIDDAVDKMKSTLGTIIGKMKDK